MATQALLLPMVPVDESLLRSALESAAIPGFTGSLLIQIGFQEDRESCSGEVRYAVVIEVQRRESCRTKQDAAEGGCAPLLAKQILPDVQRRKPVCRVLAGLSGKLFVRPMVQRVEIHYRDGFPQDNYTIQG